MRQIILILTHLLYKTELSPLVHLDCVLAWAIHHLKLAWCSLCLCRLLIRVGSCNTRTLFNIDPIICAALNLTVFGLGIAHLVLFMRGIFGDLGIDLTWLTDADALARLRDLHTGSHLTTDNDVFFQELDRVVLRVIVVLHVTLDALILAMDVL